VTGCIKSSIVETLLAYPHDYFGDILAENQHGRHLGFFPTPMQVSEFMALMTLGGRTPGQRR
jgi:hypothetical protein